MTYIKKKVDSFTLTKFHPDREYTITLTNSASYSVGIESGSYSSTQNIYSYGNKEHTHYIINQLFYKQYKSPYYFSSADHELGWFKQLNQESKIIFIPRFLIGDRIKGGSVQLSGSSNAIKVSDNFYGQLIDDSATNIVSSSNLAGFWSFDDGYSTDGVRSDFSSISLRHIPSSMEMNNVMFPVGIRGVRYCAAFDGTGYGRISEYANVKLEKDDNFAISFWLNIPVSQSVTSSTLNTIISKGDEASKNYFFKLDLYNQTDAGNTRKIKAYRKYGAAEASVTSSALTAGQFYHVIFQKTGSTLELFVNDSSEGTATDNTPENTYFKDRQNHLVLAGFIQSESLNVVPELSGSIDEVRFYDKGLSAAEITDLYTNPYNTNIVGNVYYKHGIIVLNNLSGSYNSLYTAGADTLKYKSVVEITETRTELTKFPSEFNFTLNPTIFKRSSNFDNKDLIATISSSFSDFSPYITTIGLMNDKSEILAVVKLKTPLKANQDLPIKFVIKIDI